ncbi:hypothetical protein EDC04DRAFT_2614952 [Pisolithus marmoratus]|nr:hypothetical protein EDC04DRAFT_2614952 [Pisolithus marmoratus]
MSDKHREDGPNGFRAQHQLGGIVGCGRAMAQQKYRYQMDNDLGMWEDDAGNIIGRQQPQTIGNPQEQDGGGAAGPGGETSGPEAGPSNAGSSMGEPQAIPSSAAPTIGFSSALGYSIQATDDEDVYQITQKNFHDNVPVAKHHCFIPSCYGLPVIVFLWKYYLYIGLYSQFHCHHQKKKPFLPYLKRCIVHLDNVIEAFICPILSIPFDKIADYHSKSFDEYLITETILGHHDPEAFKIFHSRCPINIERMDAEDFTDVSTCVPWEDDYGNIIYPPAHWPHDGLDESYPHSPDHGSYDPFDADMRSMEIKREELEGGARPIGFDSSLVAGMSYRSSMDQPTSSIQSREPCQGKDQIFEEETIKAHHPSLELQYDKVVVTISPCKKPMVMSGHSQQLCDVSPTILRPTAGPSHSSKSTIQTASTPSDEAIQNDVPSVLKDLPAVLHSLAKKSIGDEEDIVEQFVKVFSTLKDAGKTHQLQVSTMFSKIKANKHAYYLKHNLVEDVMKLGTCNEVKYDQSSPDKVRVGTAVCSV